MRGIMILSMTLAAASPARADSDVEHARYSVISSAGEIEIRSYAPQIVAETTVSGARDAAINEGFRRLAGYIFGANEPGGKIEMTVPVVQARGEKIEMTAPVAQERSGGDWKVRFTMPAKHTMESLPRQPTRRCGLSSFRESKWRRSDSRELSARAISPSRKRS